MYVRMFDFNFAWPQLPLHDVSLRSSHFCIKHWKCCWNAPSMYTVWRAVSVCRSKRALPAWRAPTYAYHVTSTKDLSTWQANRWDDCGAYILHTVWYVRMWVYIICYIPTVWHVRMYICYTLYGMYTYATHCMGCVRTYATHCMGCVHMLHTGMCVHTVYSLIFRQSKFQLQVGN